jgi:hypothetical protein
MFVVAVAIALLLVVISVSKLFVPTKILVPEIISPVISSAFISPLV